MMINTSNCSFYFFKDEEYGKEITKYELKNNYEKLFKISDEGFELTTTYPGLLIGSGYLHPKPKSKKEDFQLGFAFDYTTGLPIISGSTIKGVIRSAFGSEKDVLKDEKIKFIKSFYKSKNRNFDYEKEIKKLFESKKVIFYDAYIKKAKNNKIFGEDYINHHKSEIEAPNPIKFLVILPEVTFRFQFIFNSFSKEDIEFYKSLFKEIILFNGIGARTNVGYGAFRE